LLLVGCAGAAPRPDSGSSATRYAYVIALRPAGTSLTTLSSDGLCTSDLAYLNNGRGPKAHLVTRLAADGTLASFDATGTDTFGTPIDEHFSVEAGRARWQSTLEKGERNLSRPAFYLPVAPRDEHLGLLARALLESGGRIDLLPEGEARLERETALDVEAGGERRHLTSYLIHGIDLAPARVWLDDDTSLFAVIDVGFAFVREGWESVVAKLEDAQKPLDARRAEALAQRLAHRPGARGLAIVNARVFDSPTKSWLAAPQTVIVKGEHIEAVGPSSRLKAPEGAEVIDANGKALLPGLWDTHAHLSRGEPEQDIAAGVTTIRDVGNDPDWLDDQLRRFDEGSAIGPRIIRAGFIEGRGPNASGSAVTATTEEEARKGVAEFARRGYEEIKIYNSIKPALVPVLTSEAHAHKMRASGHIPVGMIASGAIRAGYDEVQHINQLMLNFFADETTNTATLLRFTLPGEKAAGLDLAGAPVRAFIAQLKEARTVVTPTLCAFEGLYLEKPGDLLRGLVPLADRLPPAYKRANKSGGLEIPKGQQEAYRMAFPAMQRFVKLLWDSGVSLTAGTDGPSGLLLPYELELLVQSGIPAADVLQMATLGAARVLRREERSGSIAPGKDADLILVDGDPLARIGDVRRVVTVIKAGVVFDSATLFEAAGIRRW